MAFSSSCKFAQRSTKWKLKMFEDGIERPILAGSLLRINAWDRACPGFRQFLICSDMGPDLQLALSHQRLKWSCSDLPHRCLPIPLLAAQPPLPQKEAFPLYFFWNTFTSCFLQPLTLCCMSLWQLRRCTAGHPSGWRLPKASGVLTEISSNYDSFKLKEIITEK